MGLTFETCSPEEGFNLKGEQKLQFVSEMFDRIAVSYDKVNLFISFGQTTLWRFLALSWIHRMLFHNAKVLDVGCGTGWVSWFLNRRYARLHLNIEAMDCSQEMLKEARRLYPKAMFSHGDVCNLSYKDGSFNLVTTVYTLRNFPDLFQGLQEMVRVTAPGGYIVILDAFPVRGPMKLLLKVWLNYIVPPLASYFIERKPYEYLANSIQSTISSSEVGLMLQQLGCDSLQQQSYSFGAAIRIVARKPF
jgi:demethylmenaquinone methyltransferase/2-methoxy-6-polyprenyl-1,4-benzoquinol methylase